MKEGNGESQHRVSTIYNNTVLTLDAAKPNLLRYLPIVSGQTAWKEFLTQGPAPSPEELDYAFMCAASDVVYVVPTSSWISATPPSDATAGQRVPLGVLDCRKMQWTSDFLLLPEVLTRIVDITPVVPAKSNFREGVAWFHGTALLAPMSDAPDVDLDCCPPSAMDDDDDGTDAKNRGKKKSTQPKPGMFVIEIDFAMRLIIVVNLVRGFPSPVHHHNAFQLPNGNGVLLCAGWRSGTGLDNLPNEETILWVWGEDIPGSIAAGEAPEHGDDDEDVGNGSSNNNTPRVLLDKLLAPNVTRIFSTMPCEYDKRFYFKFDDATRRLVWVGPSTWYLEIDNPYRQWRRLRSAKDQVCRSGIPPLGKNALVVLDVASGRQLMVEDGGEVLFMCNTCDAPARVIPIASPRKLVPAPLLSSHHGAAAATSSSASHGGGKSKKMMLPLHPEPPQAFTSYASSIPLVPVQPKSFAASGNPRKKAEQKKKKDAAAAAEDDEINSQASTAKSMNALNTLLTMAKKTRHNIAPALRIVANDETDVILDLSNCESLDAEEFFCIRRVLLHCPHVMALRLASMAIITDTFLEGISKLTMILDVEFSDMSIPGSRSALTALDAILERHRQEMEEKESGRAEVNQRKEARRQRRQMIREERATRRAIREQVLLIIDEQINRLMIRQHEERSNIFISARLTSEATWHNRNAGATFVCQIVLLQQECSRVRRETEDEERRELDQLLKEELKQRNEILRRERLEIERQRKEEAERLRELRRKLRERIEAFADVERKARHVVKQEEEGERSNLARLAAISLDKAKERLHRRLREEAEARQREFERLRRIEEMERAFAAAVIDFLRVETAKRAEIKKEEDKEFLVMYKKYREDTAVLRLQSIRDSRRKDRAECDALPPVLKLTGAKLKSHVRIPLLNVLPQRLFHGIDHVKDPNVHFTAELARVPRHLRGAHETLDPPLEPGELNFTEWQTMKLAVQTVTIYVKFRRLPEGISVSFVRGDFSVVDGLLYEKGIQEPVGQVTMEEVNLDESTTGGPKTTFVVKCTSCTTPLEALELLSALALDTSNCYVEAPSFDLTPVASLELAFCDPSQGERTTTACQQFTTTVTLESSYMVIPRDDLLQHFIEGDKPLPVLLNSSVVVADSHLLLDCTLTVLFAGEHVDANDQIQISPTSRFTVQKDGSIKYAVYNNKVFCVVENRGCLYAPVMPQAAENAQQEFSNFDLMKKIAGKLVRGLGDKVVQRLRTCTFKIVTPDITAEALTQFVRSIEYVNNSPSPIEGMKTMILTLSSATTGLHFARQLYVQVSGVDNPCEMNMNLPLVTFRTAPTIPPAHQQYVSQPHCFFGQYATVVDPDTVEFSGGYLKVGMEGYVAGDAFDIVPRDGTNIGLADDGVKILHSGKEVAELNRTPSQLFFKFLTASIPAVEGIVRCLTFSTQRPPKAGVVAACAITVELKVADAKPVSASVPLKISEPLFVIASSTAFLTYKEGAPPVPLPPLRMCTEDSNWCGGWVAIDFTTGFVSGEDWFVLNETNLMRLVDASLEVRRNSKAAAVGSGPAKGAAISTMMIKSSTNKLNLCINRDVYIDDRKIGVASLTLSQLRVDFVKENDKAPRAAKTVTKKDVALVLKHVQYKNLSEDPKSVTKIVVVTCNDGGAQGSSCPIQIDVQATDSPTELVVKEESDRTYRLGAANSGSSFLLLNHVTLHDPDSYSFNGATINVDLVSGGENNGTDNLSVVPSATTAAAGGEGDVEGLVSPTSPLPLVNVDGKSIFCGTRLVAKFSGGGSQPLAIKFNPYPKGLKPATTAEQVRDDPTASYISLKDCIAVLQRIAYSCTAAKPLQGQRLYMVKFASAGLTSQAKIPVQVVPCPLVNMLNGPQPRYKTKEKKNVVIFPCLTVATLNAKKGALSVALTTSDKRDVLTLQLPDKTDLSIKGTQLVEGKTLIGEIVQDGPQNIALNFDVTCKILPKHAQTFYRSIQFSTNSNDGFERIAEASLLNKDTNDTTTVSAKVQVIADDEPTEIILDESAERTVCRGGARLLIAHNASVVDPDTEHFEEPDHIVVSIRDPDPDGDVLYIDGLEEDAEEVFQGDRLLARIDNSELGPGSMKLVLVDLSLPELQSLVRRIAYKAVETSQASGSSNARSIEFLVRTGRSFSRTNLAVDVIPPLLIYSGPSDTVSIIPGASPVSPFVPGGFTLRPTAFYASACTGSIELEKNAVFTLSVQVPAEGLPQLSATPWPDGSLHITHQSKKVGMIHAVSPLCVNFSIVAGLPQVSQMFAKFVASIVVSCPSTISTDELSSTAVATLHVTDDKTPCSVETSLVVAQQPSP